MATLTEATRVADVVKQEPNGYAGRETPFVDQSQTLTIGEIVRRGASGRVVAYAAGANEKQQCKCTGADGGTFLIRAVLADGSTGVTDPIAYNANAAGILTGLDTIFTSGDVEISAGTTPADFTVHWIGEDYALCKQSMLELDISAMTTAEDATVMRTQTGGWGGAAVNEVHTCTQDELGTGGTYTITVDHWDGTRVTTAAIAYNATLATSQTALDLVTGNTAQITIAGEIDTDADLVFTYDGSMYRGRNIKTLVSIDVSSLTTTTTSTAVETTKGGPGGEEVPYGICLKDVTTAGGAYTTEGLFLTRGPAAVDVDKLDFGSGIRLDILEGLRTLGIVCRDEA